jgi:acetate CoA/acetoacetate CoA-transferase alpha subunit
MTPAGESVRHSPGIAKTRPLADALACVRSGMRILVGGFGERGFPFKLVEEVQRLGVNTLTIIKSDGNEDDIGVGRLIAGGQVARVIMSHIGLNRRLGQMINDGTINAEICPQGILAERVRAGGAGLGGVLSDIGIETTLSGSKQRVNIGGKIYLVEEAIRADLALIHAHRSDYAGNLTYRHAARNFNPLMAMAADYVVAEAEEFVPTGVLRPDDVMTPCVFVDAVVHVGAGN